MFKFFVAACLMLFPVAAQAGILGPLANMGAVRLEDDDWETQISGFADGTLDRGDLLLAVIEVQRVTDVLGTADNLGNGSLSQGGTIVSYAPSTRAITGISLIKVDSVVSNLGGFGAQYSFVGADIAEWAGIGVAVSQNNTGAILFDDPINLAGHIDFSTIANGISSTIEGTRLAEFTVNSWIAQATDFGGTPTVVGAIDFLSFVAGLSTTDARFGTVDVLRDPDFGLTGPNLAFFQGMGPVDLQLQGGLGTGDRGAFALVTDTDLYVNVVPEPASLSVWGLVAACGLGFRRRKS